MWKILFALFSVSSALIDYSTPIRGVSLGSWLTVEFFLTPSLFNGTSALSEYTLTRSLGKERSREVLEPHWKNFIQKSDFERMASWGINFIRLPVGYYAFLLRDDDPYIDGQLPYIDLAMEWAREYGIQVVLDIHVAPGWENFENLGDSSGIWAETPAYIDDTVEVVRRIVGNATTKWQGVLTGIELLNEPLSPLDAPFGIIFRETNFTDKFFDSLHSYYERAMDVMPQNISAVMNDFGNGAPDPNDWFLDNKRISVDYHWYDISTTNLTGANPPSENVPEVCKYAPIWFSHDPRHHFVGEFSGTRSECERILAQYSEGLSGCEGVLDINSDYWSQEYRDDTRRFIEAQLDAFEYSGQGWVFWTYKTEDRISIDLGLMIEYGMFPQPFDDRRYPNQCNYTNSSTSSQISHPTSSLSSSVVSSKSIPPPTSTKSSSSYRSNVSTRSQKNTGSSSITSKMSVTLPSLASSSTKSSHVTTKSSQTSTSKVSVMASRSSKLPSGSTILSSHSTNLPSSSLISTVPEINPTGLSTQPILKSSGMASIRSWRNISESSVETGSSSLVEASSTPLGSHISTTSSKETTPKSTASQIASSSSTSYLDNSQAGFSPSQPQSSTSAAQLSGEPTAKWPVTESIPSSSTEIMSPFTTIVSSFTTVCPSSTKFSTNGVTYTATGGETITVTDCPCTLSRTTTNSATTTLEREGTKPTGTDIPTPSLSTETAQPSMTGKEHSSGLKGGSAFTESPTESIIHTEIPTPSLPTKMAQPSMARQELSSEMKGGPTSGGSAFTGSPTESFANLPELSNAGTHVGPTLQFLIAFVVPILFF